MFDLCEPRLTHVLGAFQLAKHQETLPIAFSSDSALTLIFPLYNEINTNLWFIAELK